MKNRDNLSLEGTAQVHNTLQIAKDLCTIQLNMHESLALSRKHQAEHADTQRQLKEHGSKIAELEIKLAKREFEFLFRSICKGLQKKMVEDIAPNAEHLGHLVELRRTRKLSKDGFAKYKEYQEWLGGSIAKVKKILVRNISNRNILAHQGEEGFPKINVIELEEIMKSFPIDDTSVKIVEIAKRVCPDMFEFSQEEEEDDYLDDEGNPI